MYIFLSSSRPVSQSSQSRDLSKLSGRRATFKIFFVSLVAGLMSLERLFSMIIFILFEVNVFFSSGWKMGRGVYCFFEVCLSGLLCIVPACMWFVSFIRSSLVSD